MFHNTFGRGWVEMTKQQQQQWMTCRNSVLNNNKQEPVFWCIIKKGAVQEPFASHRVCKCVSVRKLMKSDLVSPSAVWTIEFDSIDHFRILAAGLDLA